MIEFIEMQKPLIGVTSGEVFNRDYPWSPVTYGQRHTFIDAVVDGGGVPIILPLTKDTKVIDEISDRLDGLLLSGGNDIHPIMYGEKPGGRLLEPSHLRDGVEKQLLKNALQKDTPILGLCRGMQLINVYNGGTLYQDIETDLRGKVNHESSNIARDIKHRAHHITIDKDSKLYKIVGLESVDVNTHHHQAIKKLGKGIRVTAVSPDGIIEAIETDDDRFIIGIQAHPESLGSVIPDWDKLFVAFAEAAANSVK